MFLTLFSLFVFMTVSMSLFYFLFKHIKIIFNKKKAIDLLVNQNKELDKEEQTIVFSKDQWEEKKDQLSEVHELIQELSSLSLMDHKIKKIIDLIPSFVPARDFTLLLKMRENHVYPYSFFLDFSKDKKDFVPRSQPHKIESLYLSYLSHNDLSQISDFLIEQKHEKGYLKNYLEEYDIDSFYVVPFFHLKEYGCLIIQNPDLSILDEMKHFFRLVAQVMSLGFYIRDYEIKQNLHYFVVNNELAEHQTYFVPYNYFLEIVNQEVKRHESLQKVLSVVKIQLSFEDKTSLTYLQREILLEKFHMILRQTLRETDLVSYFKDTFFCLLLETDPLSLNRVKDRVYSKMNTSFLDQELSCVRVDWRLVTFPDQAQSVEDLISSVVEQV